MQTPRKLDFEETFLTGVEEIDSQHRNLVNLTNEAAVVLAQAASTAQIRHVVQELLSYAIYHFRTEESLMRQYGYADEPDDVANSHIESHRGFAAKVVAAQEALQNHQAIDTAQLVDYLTDWIRHHIMGTDQRLAAFILRKRAGHGA